MINIYVNCIYQSVIDNKAYRVLWINNDYKFAFIIDINDGKWPRSINLLYLIDQIAKREVIIIDEDPFKSIILDGQLTPLQEQTRSNRWEMIKDLIVNEPLIYTKKKRQLILNKCQAIGCSENTLNRLLKRYWKRGMSINSLLKDYKHTNDKQKRGRKSLKNTGFIVDKKAKRNFRAILNAEYYNNKGNTIQFAYERLIEKYYSTSSVDDNDDETIILLSAYPSIRQFRYFIQTEKNAKKFIATRSGYKYFQQTARPLTGSSAQDASYSSAVYQIDASISDIYLRTSNSSNNNDIAGRPVIYVVSDVYSKEIVGFNVSFSGPDYQSAMAALFTACTDKTELCLLYGIDIKDRNLIWHYGVPNVLLADRGEIESKFADQLSKGLNIKVQNTSAYRGDMKGVIERAIGDIQNQILPFLPGKVQKRARHQKNKDYRLDALLDIKQFTKALILWILHYNNNHAIDIALRDVNNDIVSTPVGVWSWGVKNRSGSIRKVDKDILLLNFFKQSKASITAKGIKHKGLFYTCKRAYKENWFVDARLNGSTKIDILFDSRNTSSIYIPSDDFKRFEKCTLVDYMKNLSDLSYEEVERIYDLRTEKKKELAESELMNKIQFSKEIKDIVEDAKTALTSTMTIDKSNASRLSNIKANKEYEKKIESIENSVELGFSEESIIMKKEVKSDEFNDYKLLLKALEKENIDE